MEKCEISQAVIRRLPRYYRYLGALRKESVERISSGELSRRMKVTASQIRQDLRNFGGFGQQGYGYNVENLYQEIGKILGLKQTKNCIIIGAGNMGRALANSRLFENYGFVLTGIFDVRSEFRKETIRGVPIYMISELEDFLQREEVAIAVLTLPKTQVLKVVDVLEKGGVKGLWNFVHMDLNVPAGMQVVNVHLSDSLMNLSYNIAWEEAE